MVETIYDISIIAAKFRSRAAKEETERRLEDARAAEREAAAMEHQRQMKKREYMYVLQSAVLKREELAVVR